MSSTRGDREYDPANIVETEYGFALAQAEAPFRRDIFWKQIPSGHIYTFDGDGWLRVSPPERQPLLPGNLKHG
jgi:hypothetical protein